MCKSCVAGQTTQGHVHEVLQGARPLLRDLGDLLAPQEELAWGQHVHGLVQRIYHYCLMTCLFLQKTHTQTAIIQNPETVRLWQVMHCTFYYMFMQMLLLICVNMPVICLAQQYLQLTVDPNPAPRHLV